MKMTLGFFGACALACWIFPYLAVLSQDIFQVDPLTIGETRVTMTMVGGKIVYTAE
jgi:hypothetical protein